MKKKLKQIIKGKFRNQEVRGLEDDKLLIPLSFIHVQAPMAECWDQMSAGMKVEVSCGEEGITKDAYWVATVIAIGGKTKERIVASLEFLVRFV